MLKFKYFGQVFSNPIWVRTTDERFLESEKRIFEDVKTPMTNQKVPAGDGIFMNTWITETEGPPLVCCHGWGAGCGFFFKQIDDFAKHFKVYLVDWVGFGRSSRPKYGGTTHADAEDFFLKPFEEWRLTMGLDSFYLLGHSLGGYLSVCYAIKHPDRVRLLVLASPGGVPAQPALDERGVTAYQNESPVVTSASLEVTSTTAESVTVSDQNITASANTSTTTRLTLKVPPGAGGGSSSDNMNILDGVLTGDGETPIQAVEPELDAGTMENVLTQIEQEEKLPLDFSASPQQPATSALGGTSQSPPTNATPAARNPTESEAVAKSAEGLRKRWAGGSATKAAWRMRIIKALWSTNVSSVIRTAGPYGPTLIKRWCDRRFGGLVEEHFADYVYHLSATPGASGEEATRSIFAIGAWANAPLVDRVHELRIPALFLYGCFDWMDYHGGKTCVLERMPKESATASFVLRLADATHQLFIDNPGDFNRCVLAYILSGGKSTGGLPCVAGEPQDWVFPTELDQERESSVGPGPESTTIVDDANLGQ